MKAIGHAILGDPKYGDEAAIGLSEGIARTIAWHRDSRHADGCPRTLDGDGNAA